VFKNHFFAAPESWFCTLLASSTFSYGAKIVIVLLNSMPISTIIVSKPLVRPLEPVGVRFHLCLLARAYAEGATNDSGQQAPESQNRLMAGHQAPSARAG
jgi:hypothetical protein